MTYMRSLGSPTACLGILTLCACPGGRRVFGGVHTMEELFQLLAERRIQEAIEEGLFDNLPGAGRPLDLSDLAPPHVRLLRSANVLPDWLQMDLEIRQLREACNQLRERVSREYAARSRSADYPDWRARCRSAYHQRMRSVNMAIIKLNMVRPTILSEQIPFRIAEELARFDREIPPARETDS